MRTDICPSIKHVVEVITDKQYNYQLLNNPDYPFGDMDLSTNKDGWEGVSSDPTDI